jgi:hypothetical protein
VETTAAGLARLRTSISALSGTVFRDVPRGFNAIAATVLWAGPMKLKKGLFRGLRYRIIFTSGPQYPFLPCYVPQVTRQMM